MTLFSAANKRDSISLLKFPFLSPVQIFWCEISLVCRLKYLYNCFSSHFCCLVIVLLLILALFMLFLIAVISLFFFTFSCSIRVVLSIDWRYLQYCRDVFLFLFLTYIACLYPLWDIRPCRLSWVFLLTGPFVGVPGWSILRMVLSILRGNSPGIYLFNENSAI